MPGVTHIKSGGTWQCINFNTDKYTVHVKDAGVWKSISKILSSKGIYVKDGGSWMQVYPSPTSAWTDAEYGTSYTVGPSTVVNIDKASSIINAPNSTSYDAHWDGQGVSIGEQTIGVKGHAWSPSTTFGEDYGYARRIELTAKANTVEKLSTYGDSIALDLGMKEDLTGNNNLSIEKYMGILTQGTSGLGTTLGKHPSTLYTADYDTYAVSGWNMTADEIKTFTQGDMWAAARTNYSVSGDEGDQEAYISEFKARFKYYYN